jgi:uncharacterized protein YigE (DUF2233 family)
MLLSPSTAATPKGSRSAMRAIGALGALLLLAGCDRAGTERSAAAGPGAGKQSGACETRLFEGSTFTACRFDAARDEFRLALRDSAGQRLGSLAALEESLGEDGARVRFAMNAGMYDESGAPIGLYVAAGERLKRLNLNTGPGNFHLLPNGVFAIDGKGRVSVTPSPDFAAKVPSPRWATQSGPMLVIAGKLHPKFDGDGPSRLIRNGVGVRDRRTAFFVISEEGVSFGRFARFFRDALGCPDALFLDGSVSSLWDPAAGRQDGFAALGPMAVVLRKE